MKTFRPEFPEAFNLADYFLDARVREGRGGKVAIVCGDERWTYAETQAWANRMANLLRDTGVYPEIVARMKCNRIREMVAAAPCSRIPLRFIRATLAVTAVCIQRRQLLININVDDLDKACSMPVASGFTLDVVLSEIPSPRCSVEQTI